MLQHTETHRRSKMVTNKNAYEIRTDILGMAQGFVMEKFHSAKNNWENSTDVHPETGKILSTEHCPKYPTSDEILREAEKLYSFVDGKSETYFDSK